MLVEIFRSHPFSTIFFVIQAAAFLIFFLLLNSSFRQFLFSLFVNCSHIYIREIFISFDQFDDWRLWYNMISAITVLLLSDRLEAIIIEACSFNWVFLSSSLTLFIVIVTFITVLLIFLFNIVFITLIVLAVTILIALIVFFEALWLDFLEIFRMLLDSVKFTLISRETNAKRNHFHVGPTQSLQIASLFSKVFYKLEVIATFRCAFMDFQFIG